MTAVDKLLLFIFFDSRIDVKEQYQPLSTHARNTWRRIGSECNYTSRDLIPFRPRIGRRLKRVTKNFGTINTTPQHGIIVGRMELLQCTAYNSTERCRWNFYSQRYKYMCESRQGGNGVATHDLHTMWADRRGLRSIKGVDAVRFAATPVATWGTAGTVLAIWSFQATIA